MDQILLRVPAGQLFSLQHVDKTWQGVIKGSQKLQKRMFGGRGTWAAIPHPYGTLLPQYGPKVWYYKHLSPAITLTPLLEINLTDDKAKEVGKIDAKVKDCKAIKAFASSEHRCGPLSHLRAHFELHFSKIDLSPVEKAIPSWMAAALSSPPITAVKFSGGGLDMDYCRHDGLTLGRIYMAHQESIEALWEKSVHIDSKDVVARFSIYQPRPECEEGEKKDHSTEKAACFSTLVTGLGEYGPRWPYAIEKK